MMTMETLSQELETDPRSIARYLLIVLATATPLLSAAVVARLPIEPFILAMVYGMLGGAVLMARRAGDRDGVRTLFVGALRWRVGWQNWAVAVGAIPIVAVAVAAATGTSTAPENGWAMTLGNYLFMTLIFGTLIVNLWEETVWNGLVQRHLTGRYGIRRAAVLTALPFATLHIPLAFSGDATTGQRFVNVALLVLFAPALRYILGRLDRTSGGSLLAVAVMHASFNASGAMDVLKGGWQHIAGLAIVAAIILMFDLRQDANQPPRDQEDAGRHPQAGRAEAAAKASTEE